METAYFGGGCFWCTEAIFQTLKGVIRVTPGYAGGEKDNPTYKDVGEGDSGHAEVIKIEFDPGVIPYEDLLDIFFHTHNPTEWNQQGADVGEQYRSIILYASDEQKEVAENALKRLRTSNEFERPIVTQLVPFDKFFEAEEYHKNYFKKHEDAPYCQVVISPKLKHLREKYSDKLIDQQKG